MSIYTKYERWLENIWTRIPVTKGTTQTFEEWKKEHEPTLRTIYFQHIKKYYYA